MYAKTDVSNHPCSAVSRILKAKNLLQILTKSSRLLWPPTSSQRQLGGQLFSSQVVITMIVICTCRYNSSQCTNHGCKLLWTTFEMCLIYRTHRHSIAVVVFDSNDLNWLSLEVPLWFIGRVSYYYYCHVAVRNSIQIEFSSPGQFWDSEYLQTPMMSCLGIIYT